MRVGFTLGNVGTIGTADNLIRSAQGAEALAYDSLWTVERLLWSVKPQSPYPVTPDGSLPEEYKYVLDPLEAMTFVAAHTKKVAPLHGHDGADQGRRGGLHAYRRA
jgi:alkanesulfonate monooxygenase SsuD/methylene tetrahydromethanopterin reductase-like flavin-dependent oxidoreductase (luciferase family)